MKKLFGTLVAIAAILVAFTSCKKDTDVIKLKVSQIEISVMGHQVIEVEKASGPIVWSSQDINIASVDEKGDVFGVAEGKTIVTATVGKAKANVEVTVKAGGVTPPAAGISVTDNSLADWDALPAEFVFSAECPADAAMLGLKSVKVYADAIYLNILVEPNMDDVVDLDWVPFHCYINTDNSDATGGYGDEFTDANSNILLEGGIFSGGEPNPYNPAVFKWWGEVGGDGWDWTDPSVTHDESDFWGALVGEGQLPIGDSELVDGKFEIQLVRELIPATWDANQFSIGFDIQQNWSSVGILPCAPATDENPSGKAAKLVVKINK
ncbi:MAG: Ig-like domain-containing protein [Paludibacteraceae bacterium]|nr:Ig-like domain-containing protein [Paludibacteraceae bacterium]